MATSKLVQANEKIAEKVVGGYKKIEESAVGSFNKVADKFVDKYLTKEGETVEEARERLTAEQKAREAESAETAEKHTIDTRAIVEKNMQQTMNAAKAARKAAGLE